MKLTLKYPPTPGNAKRFAEDMVGLAQEVSGVALDYSPDSLVAVDDIIGSFANDGCSVDDVAETLFGFGCYVGEVFVRSAGGRWRSPKGQEEESVFGFPMVVELAPGNVCNPIGKVFKRLEMGESENLRYFYSVFAGDHSAPRAEGGSWMKRLFGK